MKRVQPRLNAFINLIGLDRAVLYSVLLRILSTAGGLVTIPLILTRLNPTEQGYYYTFASILALQVFLEMGFSTVAVQMMAHESAHLEIDLAAGIKGPQLNLDRFSATFRFIRRWYAVLSVLVGLLLLPVGFLFFSTSKDAIPVHWVGPWVLLVLSTAGDLFVRSLDSTIEGMGFVADSIRVNIMSAAIRIILSVFFLLVGFRLYAMPLASAIALIVNRWSVWRLLRVVDQETRKHGKDVTIDWRVEVFPFQWRIALSWVLGWFSFNAMMPVAFRALGPVEAGRFGLAVSLSTFIHMFASNWASTKAARWGQLASRGEWKAMDDSFGRVVRQAVGISVLGSVLAIGLIPHLGEWVPRFSGRVPGGRLLGVLCLAVVMNQVVFAEAFYLRAHKKEPFLVTSVVGGVAMGVFLFGFVHTSAIFIASGYTILTLLIGLIWGSILFWRFRKIWHGDVSPKESNS